MSHSLQQLYHLSRPTQKRQLSVYDLSWTTIKLTRQTIYTDLKRFDVYHVAFNSNRCSFFSSFWFRFNFCTLSIHKRRLEIMKCSHFFSLIFNKMKQNFGSNFSWIDYFSSNSSAENLTEIFALLCHRWRETSIFNGIVWDEENWIYFSFSLALSFSF